jgi:hypothetical protein
MKVPALQKRGDQWAEPFSNTPEPLIHHEWFLFHY